MDKINGIFKHETTFGQESEWFHFEAALWIVSPGHLQDDF